ncbi:S1C family serine protease [Bacillus sp. FSL W8-0116]|uniref:S1C family serine protease n=1 Tax=Bacillus sp. FSL W8-0116 TaxID=2978206 RepID=UPI0030FC3CC7
MGFYDEDPAQKKTGRGKGGYFLASLAGLIVGALLVLIALPRLTDQSILNSGTGTDNTETNQTVRHKKVSVNVTTDVTKAVSKAKDAVVGISNIQSTSFWDTGETKSEEAGSGSGVIYKKVGNRAFIVTNYHVIEGAEKLEVTLADGTKVPAKVRGGDIWTDLAVLEIDGSHVKKVAEFGDSSALKQGEPVIAIGNPLGLEFSGSVTEGIVSGLERTVPVDIDQDGVEDWQAEVIQTDAAINPGNSGGALINLAGQVVGINSMKISQEAVEGIGFSIPINYAEPIISSLEKYGKIQRPAMGVTLRNVNEISAYHQQETLKLPSNVKDGVMIEQVLPNSPADKAGLKELDVIVQLDDQKIHDILGLRKYLYNNKKTGDTITVKFYREGKLKTTTVKLTSENSF